MTTAPSCAPLVYALRQAKKLEEEKALPPATTSINATSAVPRPSPLTGTKCVGWLLEYVIWQHLRPHAMQGAAEEQAAAGACSCPCSVWILQHESFLELSTTFPRGRTPHVCIWAMTLSHVVGLDASVMLLVGSLCFAIVAAVDPEVLAVIDSWDSALIGAYAHYAKQVHSHHFACLRLLVLSHLEHSRTHLAPLLSSASFVTSPLFP